MTDQALSGIRVVELGEHVSGPFCGKMLAAFGAEVVKIESPGRGDCARGLGPFPGDDPHPERSGAFLYLNTGKKSITLDIRTDTGLVILKGLLGAADILVENLQPGALAGLGLGPASLHEANPGMIVTSITGYGQTGPYRHYKTATIAGYALSGHQYITGEQDREPLQGPGPQPDYQGGLHGFFGTLAALYAREDSGEGQHVDVSIMECMTGFHQFTIIRYTYGGEVKRRTGNRYESNHPITIYPCRDGYIALSASSPMQQELLYALIEQPEIPADPRFLTPLDRLANAADLDALVMPWFKERTQDEAFHTCSQWRIPCAPVTSPGDLIEDPHFKARDFWVEAEHPEAGRLTYPGAPYRMSLTPWRPGRAPLLGEHNEDVYCGMLGYSTDDLVRLREVGII